MESTGIGKGSAESTSAADTAMENVDAHGNSEDGSRTAEDGNPTDNDATKCTVDQTPETLEESSPAENNSSECYDVHGNSEESTSAANIAMECTDDHSSSEEITPTANLDMESVDVHGNSEGLSPATAPECTVNIYEKRTIPLKNIPERRVIFAGIARSYEELVLRRDTDITLLGEACRWQKRSFYARLLKGEVEFKSLPGSDVSAAEWDLRNLTVQQLLFIRNQTLDFETEGKSMFLSHNSFLNKVESYLFELLGRILLSGDEAPSATKHALHSFGTSVATALGAVALMSKLHSEHDLPPVWVFLLDEAHWHGRAALLHVKELWADDIPCDKEELCDLMPDDENSVTAVCDRSSVQISSKSLASSLTAKQLSWEISVFNAYEDDVFAEMSKQAEKDALLRKSVRQFDSELKDRLTKRATAMDAACAAAAAEALKEEEEAAAAAKRNSAVSTRPRASIRGSIKSRASVRLSHATLATSYLELCGQPDEESPNANVTQTTESESPAESSGKRRVRIQSNHSTGATLSMDIDGGARSRPQDGLCSRCSETCAIS